jgi:nucleoprotein TPR
VSYLASCSRCSADSSTSCEDLTSQNTLLHNHLESVSTQAAKIRDAANTSSTTPEGEASDSNLAELRSVVGWLRKEKEIVELQWELSKQETARFKAQADHFSQSLQQAQASLSEVQRFGSRVSFMLTPRTGEGTCR